MRTVAVVEAKSQFSVLLSLTATIGGIGVFSLFLFPRSVDYCCLPSAFVFAVK